MCIVMNILTLAFEVYLLVDLLEYSENNISLSSEDRGEHPSPIPYI